MEEERTPTTNELREILAKLGLPGITDEAIRAFTVEEDGGTYAVWRIDAGSGSYVLKRAKAYEIETYRCFFRDKKPYAPAFYGSCAFGGAEYLLMEYCPGEDLRRCEREKLRKALDALIEMQEEFWQREALYGSAFTLEQSLVGIENRGRYLGSKRLEEVYTAFVKICWSKSTAFPTRNTGARLIISCSMSIASGSCWATGMTIAQTRDTAIT